MKIEMPRRPDGIAAHNFKTCDTHGGGAFRHWCSLMYHKGVFIGFEDHVWVVYVSSDPAAKWSRGCQESRAHGDPMPQSSTATLMSWNQTPDEVKPIAVDLVAEAVAIARSKIATQEALDSAEKQRAADARNAAIQSVVSNWVKGDCA